MTPRLTRRIHLFPRSLRFWWQRRTRGWDDSDTWSLDMTIARFILPRLRRFKELNCGTPCGITEAKWEAALDDMIYAMEKYASDEQFAVDDRARIGAELLGEWFGDLWW